MVEAKSTRAGLSLSERLTSRNPAVRREAQRDVQGGARVSSGGGGGGGSSRTQQAQKQQEKILIEQQKKRSIVAGMKLSERLKSRNPSVRREAELELGRIKTQVRSQTLNRQSSSRKTTSQRLQVRADSKSLTSDVKTPTATKRARDISSLTPNQLQSLLKSERQDVTREQKEFERELSLFQEQTKDLPRGEEGQILVSDEQQLSLVQRQLSIVERERQDVLREQRELEQVTQEIGQSPFAAVFPESQVPQFFPEQAQEVGRTIRERVAAGEKPQDVVLIGDIATVRRIKKELGQELPSVEQVSSARRARIQEIGEEGTELQKASFTVFEPLFEKTLQKEEQALNKLQKNFEKDIKLNSVPVSTFLEKKIEERRASNLAFGRKTTELAIEKPKVALLSAGVGTALGVGATAVASIGPVAATVTEGVLIGGGLAFAATEGTKLVRAGREGPTELGEQFAETTFEVAPAVVGFGAGTAVARRGLGAIGIEPKPSLLTTRGRAEESIRRSTAERQFQIIGEPLLRETRTTRRSPLQRTDKESFIRIKDAVPSELNIVRSPSGSLRGTITSPQSQFQTTGTLRGREITIKDVVEVSRPFSKRKQKFNVERILTPTENTFNVFLGGRRVLQRKTRPRTSRFEFDVPLGESIFQPRVSQVVSEFAVLERFQARTTVQKGVQIPSPKQSLLKRSERTTAKLELSQLDFFRAEVTDPAKTITTVFGQGTRVETFPTEFTFSGKKGKPALSPFNIVSTETSVVVTQPAFVQRLQQTRSPFELTLTSKRQKRQVGRVITSTFNRAFGRNIGKKGSLLVSPRIRRGRSQPVTRELQIERITKLNKRRKIELPDLTTKPAIRQTRTALLASSLQSLGLQRFSSFSDLAKLPTLSKQNQLVSPLQQPKQSLITSPSLQSPQLLPAQETGGSGFTPPSLPTFETPFRGTGLFLPPGAGGIGRRRGRAPRSKRKFAPSPTLLGVELGITGKGITTATGFEPIRPIPL